PPSFMGTLPIERGRPDGVSAAARAAPVEIETVPRDLIARFLGHLPAGFGQGPLEAGGGGEVDEGAAGGAEDVVMVAGQVLGQLEAAEVVHAGQAASDSGLAQDREVAVG